MFGGIVGIGSQAVTGSQDLTLTGTVMCRLVAGDGNVNRIMLCTVQTSICLFCLAECIASSWWGYRSDQ